MGRRCILCLPESIYTYVATKYESYYHKLRSKEMLEVLLIWLEF